MHQKISLGISKQIISGKCISVSKHDFRKVHGDLETDDIRKMQGHLEMDDIRKMHGDLETDNIRKMHGDLETDNIRKMHGHLETDNIRKMHLMQDNVVILFPLISYNTIWFFTFSI